MSLLLSLRSVGQQRLPCRRVLQHSQKRENSRIIFARDDSLLLRKLSFFSTTTTSSNDGTVDRKKTRLPRTLYRQLLRWCQTTGGEMPLTPFIDPFSLSPPQVDLDQLQALKEYHDSTNQQKDQTASLIATVHGLLPPRCHIQDDQIMFQVRNANELKRVIQAMFRLNKNSSTDEDLHKTRITYAFQTLRTLNELSEALSHLNKHRENHRNRTISKEEDKEQGGSADDEDILYFVGQVVQHKHERWRGVIAGWEKPDDNNEIGSSDSAGLELSSLTTKIYTAGDFLKRVRYEVVLDLADMHTMQATAPLIVSTQEDLEPVTDPRLCRIRSSMVSQNFRGFDPVSNTFMANDMLAYEYPKDFEIQQQLASSSSHTDTKKQEDAKDTAFAVDMAAKETVLNIQDLMEHLEQIITLPVDHEERKELDLLRSIKQKLAARDEVVSQNPHDDNYDDDDESPLALAAAHLRYIFNLTSELRDILWHRKTFQELTFTPKFSVGDVVYHQFFGFRGVVVACDHVPRANVTHWDGVRHIDNAIEKPFYRVIPDEADVEQAFGGPRGMRYICEDNLVPCRDDRTSITVKLDSLDPGWTRTLDSQGKTVFVPSSHALFEHGGDIGDDGLTEDLLKKIHDELRLWQLASRDAEQQGKSSANDGSIASFRLSLPGLFLLLESAATLDGAEAIELMIKDMFKVHPKEELHRRLEKGLTEIMRGKHDNALEIFKSLVEEDSQYAEAWNWTATCDYLKGRHSNSLESAVKALELQPMNFQTQSGIGLCLYDLGKYEESADAFRQCLDLNPWSPVSTKLSACTDILERRRTEDSKEDQPEKET